jgi:hypothetical protein
MLKKAIGWPSVTDSIATLGLYLTLGMFLASTTFLLAGGAYTAKRASDTNIFPEIDMLPDHQIQQLLR